MILNFNQRNIDSNTQTHIVVQANRCVDKNPEFLAAYFRALSVAQNSPPGCSVMIMSLVGDFDDGPTVGFTVDMSDHVPEGLPQQEVDEFFGDWPNEDGYDWIDEDPDDDDDIFPFQ